MRPISVSMALEHVPSPDWSLLTYNLLLPRVEHPRARVVHEDREVDDLPLAREDDAVGRMDPQPGVAERGR